jgi:hypothetical protein
MYVCLRCGISLRVNDSSKFCSRCELRTYKRCKCCDRSFRLGYNRFSGRNRVCKDCLNEDRELERNGEVNIGYKYNCAYCLICGKSDKELEEYLRSKSKDVNLDKSYFHYRNNVCDLCVNGCYNVCKICEKRKSLIDFIARRNDCRDCYNKN